MTAEAHVPLDLSLPQNRGHRPQCWTCGLPWPCFGGAVTDAQMEVILRGDSDFQTEAVNARLIAELRRVRTAYGEKSLENERIKESLREILYGPRNADGRSEQVAT